jgi:hypothetical protein
VRTVKREGTSALTTRTSVEALAAHGSFVDRPEVGPLMGVVVFRFNGCSQGDDDAFLGGARFHGGEYTLDL